MRGVRRAVGLTSVSRTGPKRRREISHKMVILTSVSRTGPERRRERTQTPATTRRHLARVQRNLDLMG